MLNCCPISRQLLFLTLGLAVIGGILVTTNENSAVAKSEEGKLLRHVVMFQFKDSSSKDDIQKVVEAFRELPKKIPEIADFEYGTDNSPEKLADGLTHCFLVTFKSEADRDVYLPHPAHAAFVDVLKPHLEKVVVIDYWAQQ